FGNLHRRPGRLKAVDLRIQVTTPGLKPQVRSTNGSTRVRCRSARELASNTGLLQRSRTLQRGRVVLQELNGKTWLGLYGFQDVLFRRAMPALRHFRPSGRESERK